MGEEEEAGELLPGEAGREARSAQQETVELAAPVGELPREEEEKELAPPGDDDCRDEGGRAEGPGKQGEAAEGGVAVAGGGEAVPGMTEDGPGPEELVPKLDGEDDAAQGEAKEEGDGLDKAAALGPGATPEVTKDNEREEQEEMVGDRPAADNKPTPEGTPQPGQGPIVDAMGVEDAVEDVAAQDDAKADKAADDAADKAADDSSKAADDSSKAAGDAADEAADDSSKAADDAADEAAEDSNKTGDDTADKAADDSNNTANVAAAVERTAGEAEAGAILPGGTRAVDEGEISPAPEDGGQEDAVASPSGHEGDGDQGQGAPVEAVEEQGEQGGNPARKDTDLMVRAKLEEEGEAQDTLTKVAEELVRDEGSDMDHLRHEYQQSADELARENEARKALLAKRLEERKNRKKEQRTAEQQLRDLFETFHNGLHLVFRRYCESMGVSHQKATFEQISRETAKLDFHRFNRLCKDFGIVHKKGLTQPQLKVIFIEVAKHSGDYQHLDFEGLRDVLVACADALLSRDPWAKRYGTTPLRARALFTRMDLSDDRRKELTKRMLAFGGFRVGDGKLGGHMDVGVGTFKSHDFSSFDYAKALRADIKSQQLVDTFNGPDAPQTPPPGPPARERAAAGRRGADRAKKRAPERRSAAEPDGRTGRRSSDAPQWSRRRGPPGGDSGFDLDKRELAVSNVFTLDESAERELAMSLGINMFEDAPSPMVTEVGEAEPASMWATIDDIDMEPVLPNNEQQWLAPFQPQSTKAPSQHKRGAGTDVAPAPGESFQPLSPSSFFDDSANGIIANDLGYLRAVLPLFGEHAQQQQQQQPDYQLPLPVTHLEHHAHYERSSPAPQESSPQYWRAREQKSPPPPQHQRPPHQRPPHQRHAVEPRAPLTRPQPQHHQPHRRQAPLQPPPPQQQQGYTQRRQTMPQTQRRDAAAHERRRGPGRQPGAKQVARRQAAPRRPVEPTPRRVPGLPRVQRAAAPGPRRGVVVGGVGVGGGGGGVAQRKVGVRRAAPRKNPAAVRGPRRAVAGAATSRQAAGARLGPSRAAAPRGGGAARW